MAVFEAILSNLRFQEVQSLFSFLLPHSILSVFFLTPNSSMPSLEGHPNRNSSNATSISSKKNILKMNPKVSAESQEKIESFELIEIKAGDFESFGSFTVQEKQEMSDSVVDFIKVEQSFQIFEVKVENQVKFDNFDGFTVEFEDSFHGIDVKAESFDGFSVKEKRELGENSSEALLDVQEMSETVVGWMQQVSCNNGVECFRAESGKLSKSQECVGYKLAIKTLGDTEGGRKPISCSLSTQQAYGNLKSTISETRANGFSDPIVNSDVAVKVLDGLTQHLSSTRHNLGKSSQESVLDKLPTGTKEELLHYWASIQELLKHFWSSYPITTNYLYTKVTRLKDALWEIHPKLNGIKKSAVPEFLHQVSLLVQPMLQALEDTFAHYDADMQKRSERSSKSGERPYGYA